MKRCAPFLVLLLLTAFACLALLAVHQGAFTPAPEVSFSKDAGTFSAFEGSFRQETGVSDAVSEEKRVNINRATAEELERLPKIGPVLAQRIVAYREECGVFFSVEELTEVSGIGEKTLDSLRDYVTVGEDGEAEG